MYRSVGVVKPGYVASPRQVVFGSVRAPGDSPDPSGVEGGRAAGHLPCPGPGRCAGFTSWIGQTPNGSNGRSPHPKTSWTATRSTVGNHETVRTAPRWFGLVGLGRIVASG